MVHVKSHTRADGTCTYVCAHITSLPETKSNSKSTSEKHKYVNNAFNGKHNRVGKEVGTCIISKKNPAATSNGQKEGTATNEVTVDQ